MKKSICLVGTGPVALVAFTMLKNLDINLTVIQGINSRPSNSKLNHKLILKNRFSKRWFYDSGIPIPHLKNHLFNSIETNTLGGLSNIWGGVFFYPRLENDKEYRTTNSELLEFEGFCRDKLKMHFLSSVELQKNQYFSIKRYLIEEFVPPIAFEVDSFEIWSAKDKWNIPQQKNIKFVKNTVTKLKQIKKDNKPKVYVETIQDMESVEFDEVFLACNAIGNAKIIAGSTLKKVRVKDSQTFYLIALGFKKKIQIYQKMYPRTAGYLSINNNTLYFQNYDISDELIHSFIFPRLLKFILQTLKIVKIEIKIMMVFLNGEDSAYFDIYNENKNLKIDVNNTRKFKIINYYWILLNYFKSKGFFLLPLRLKSKVGEGSHCSGMKLIDKNSESDSAFEMNLQGEIKILGMSNFTNVYGGPVTYLAMFDTYKKIKKLVESIE